MSKSIQEMTAVMLAFEKGHEIEWKHFGENRWCIVDFPRWDWIQYDYRVVPPKPKVVKKLVTLALWQSGAVSVIEYKPGTPLIVATMDAVVEFVVDGVADEKADPADKPSLLKEVKEHCEKANTQFEDGSDKLEVERLRHVVEDLKIDACDQNQVVRELRETIAMYVEKSHKEQTALNNEKAQVLKLTTAVNDMNRALKRITSDIEKMDLSGVSDEEVNVLDSVEVCRYNLIKHHSLISTLNPKKD